MYVAGTIAVAITASSLWVGWVADDFFHRAYLLDHIQGRPARGPWWNMFDTRVPVAMQIGVGGLPWWSSPHLAVALLRPLATVSQYIDYLLWPTNPAWMHLHNVILYALIVLTVSDFYARLLPKTSTVYLASLMYAMDDAHALGTAWIASRNTLLTALFGVLCLSLYQRGRTRGEAASAWLAPLALLLAHASSEGAVAIWGYLLAYAVILDPAPLVRRLRALTPLAVVSAGWMISASALGFRVSGSGAYLDPRADPVGFAMALPDRFPSLVLAQFGITDELGSLVSTPVLRIIQGVALLSVVAGLVGLARVWRRKPVALFFAVGCLLSLLPICAVGPVGRLLFISGVGAHASIALLLTSIARVRSWTWAVALSRSFVGVVLVVCACIAVQGAVSTPRWWKETHESFLRAAVTLPRGAELSDSIIMLVNTRDYLATPFIMLYRRLFAGPGPFFMHVLGVSTQAVRVFRPDDASLVLTPEGGYLNDPTSILVRSRDERFALNQEVPLLGALVRVERLTSDERPAQIRVTTFGVDNPKLLWVVWDDRNRAFTRFAPPRIGETVILPGLSENVPH